MRRIVAAAIILLLFGLTPSTAQDPDVLHREGEQARRAGRFEEAAKKLGEAARLRPDDADVQVRLGLALTPLKKFDEAERALRHALKLAPDYVDAKLGLARLDFFRKKFAVARAGVKAVLTARPDDKDARALLTQIDRAIAAQAAERRAARRRAAPATKFPPIAATPVYRWRVDLNGEWSRLTAGRSDWREGTARVAYETMPGTVVSAAAQVAQRFGVVDAYLEGRVDHKVAPWLSGYAFVGGTPAAHFSPEVAGGGGAAARLYQQPGVINATVLTFEGRYAEYVTGPVRQVTPGLEQYVLDGRLWITGKWINVLDEHNRYRQGYLVRGDIVMRDDLRFFIAYSDAPESTDAVTVETRSLYGGFIYDLDARTILRLTVIYEKRPDLFNRVAVNAGAAYRF